MGEGRVFVTFSGGIPDNYQLHLPIKLIPPTIEVINLIIAKDYSRGGYRKGNPSLGAERLFLLIRLRMLRISPHPSVALFCMERAIICVGIGRIKDKLRGIFH